MKVISGDLITKSIWEVWMPSGDITLHTSYLGKLATNIWNPCPRGLHILQFLLAVPTSQFALHSLQFVVRSWHIALHTSNFTLCSLHLTLRSSHISQFTVHTSQCILHTSQFTLHSLHSAGRLHSSHFALHSSHFTLYTELLHLCCQTNLWFVYLPSCGTTSHLNCPARLL